MTLKRSSRLLVAHGYGLKQTLLRKVSRRVILKRWYYYTRYRVIAEKAPFLSKHIQKEKRIIFLPWHVRDARIYQDRLKQPPELFSSLGKRKRELLFHGKLLVRELEF